MRPPTLTRNARKAIRRKRLVAAILLAVGGFLLWLTVYDFYLRPLARLVSPFGILYGLLGLLWPRAMVDPITQPGEPGEGRRVIPSDADRQATIFGCGVGVLALIIGVTWLTVGIVQWMTRAG